MLVAYWLMFCLTSLCYFISRTHIRDTIPNFDVQKLHCMKNAFLIILSLVLSHPTNAQIVTQQVNFDNYVSSSDNDLTHHFYPYSGSSFLLVQLNDSGITGGCLRTPVAQVANNNAAYCSKYKNIIGDTNTTSISFFWDTSIVNPSTTDYGVAIWTFPISDGMHDVHVSVSANLGFDIRGDGFSQTRSVAGLVSKHWHKLVLNTYIAGGSFGDQVNISAQVYDLGTTGTSAAVLADTVSTVIHDITYASDTGVTITIEGSRWGGVSYLDSFSYHGTKSADSCVTTGVKSINTQTTSLAIFPNPTKGIFTLHITSPQNEDVHLIIFNLFGEKVKEITAMTNEDNALQIDAPPGVYFAAAIIDGCTYTERVLVQ